MKNYLVICIDHDLENSERFVIAATSAKGALKQALGVYLKSVVDPEEIQECVDSTIESSFRKARSKGGSVWTAVDEEGNWMVTELS